MLRYIVVIIVSLYACNAKENGKHISEEKLDDEIKNVCNSEGVIVAVNKRHTNMDLNTFTITVKVINNGSPILLEQKFEHESKLFLRTYKVDKKIMIKYDCQTNEVFESNLLSAWFQ